MYGDLRPALGLASSMTINGLPAGRVGDTIQEILCPIPNFVAVGLPTVQIGG